MPAERSDAVANLERWVIAQKNGKPSPDVYDQPTADMITDVERTRAISKELQDRLPEMEKAIRIADVENALMNPSAKIPDYVEDHEYITAAVEPSQQSEPAEEKKSQGVKQFYSGKSVLVTGGTGFLGKGGRISLKASKVVQKVLL